LGRDLRFSRFFFLDLDLDWVVLGSGVCDGTVLGAIWLSNICWYTPSFPPGMSWSLDGQSRMKQREWGALYAWFSASFGLVKGSQWRVQSRGVEG